MPPMIDLSSSGLRQSKFLAGKNSAKHSTISFFTKICAFGIVLMTSVWSTEPSYMHSCAQNPRSKGLSSLPAIRQNKTGSSRHVTSTSSYVVFRNVTSRYVTKYVMLRYHMLCYFVLYYVMICNFVVCYVMLCFVML